MQRTVCDAGIRFSHLHRLCFVPCRGAPFQLHKLDLSTIRSSQKSAFSFSAPVWTSFRNRTEGIIKDRMVLFSTSMNCEKECNTPKCNPQTSEALAEMKKRIVWVDLEMAGLDVQIHPILEMACIVTDSDLNIIAEGPDLIIHYDDSVYEIASDWCKEEFTKSGLWEGVRDSKLTLAQAEKIMVDFLKEHTVAKANPLAGNSVYMDRMWLRKYMPDFEEQLHYRIIDVSTIKELSKRWYPDLHWKQPRKVLAHRSLSDIKESIAELRWYRENIFMKSPSTSDSQNS